MTHNQKVERTWVTSIKRGDRIAFSYLVEQYQQPIYNLCYRMLTDKFAAEDATQETFIRAYLKIQSYDETRKFSNWLFAIASHYCLDQLKRRRLPEVSWDTLSGWQHPPTHASTQPEQTIIANEDSVAVHHLIATLPTDYRAVVILKYWHQLSCQEVADTLQTSVSAIKSKLFRARKMMAAASEKPVNTKNNEQAGRHYRQAGQLLSHGVHNLPCAV